MFIATFTLKKITACRETLKFLQDLEFNMDAIDVTVQEGILFFLHIENFTSIEYNF